MIATARCGKCGEVGRFDVGSDVASVEEAQGRLDSARIECCPFGHHTELSPLTFEVLELQDGSAPTMDEWREQMAAKGLDLWTTDGLRATEIRITGFALGFPMAEVRGREFVLDFVTAPNGDRYYHAPAGAYAEAVGQSGEVAP